MLCTLAQQSGENMGKLTYAKDEEKLSRAVIIKQSNRPPIPWAKGPHERRVPLSPPPRPGGNPGPHP